MLFSYIRTDENVGDVMSEKLENNKHKKFVNGMGLHQSLNVHWDV